MKEFLVVLFALFVFYQHVLLAAMHPPAKIPAGDCSINK